MKHRSFAAEPCPIARSLEHVGEWWSILILRDVFIGIRRFDDLQKSLQIAPNMLTRRLSTLMESGMLERRLYSEHPPRYEYLPTELARDFRPVMYAILAWGNRHFFPEGPAVVLVDRRTGARADPLVIDRISGRPLSDTDFCSAPGPSATENVHWRYTRAGDPMAMMEGSRPAAARGNARRRPSRERT